MTGAIIVAGGTGERFGRPGGKQLAPLAGRTVVAWALEAVLGSRSVGPVVLVCDPELIEAFRRVAEESADPSRVTVAPGGARRIDSVRAGLTLLPADCDAIVVHDGARPLCEPELVDRCVAALDADPSISGAIAGTGCVDTIKRVEGSVVLDTPDRATLRQVQTPQVFRAAALRGAHEQAILDRFEGTDDASLVERAGGRVIVVEGPRTNIKVTEEPDLVVAEALLAARRGSGDGEGSG